MIFSVYAGPIGERRAGDEDGAEQFGAERRQNHHRPSTLAVADEARLAVSIRVQGDHLLQEHRFGARNILNGLPGHWLGQEAHEITWMTRFEGDTDFALGLEPANTGTMARARIDDDEGASLGINRDPFRRNDAHEAIIHRARERTPIDDELHLVTQHMRHSLGQMLAILIAALAHDVPEQHRALGRVDRVIHRRADEAGHVG
jgi:hypothetical protein